MKILIVDDDEGSRRLLQAHILDEYGTHTTANNGDFKPVEAFEAGNGNEMNGLI